MCRWLAWAHCSKRRHGWDLNPSIWPRGRGACLLLHCPLSPSSSWIRHRFSTAPVMSMAIRASQHWFGELQVLPNRRKCKYRIHKNEGWLYLHQYMQSTSKQWKKKGYFLRKPEIVPLLRPKNFPLCHKGKTAHHFTNHSFICGLQDEQPRVSFFKEFEF